MKTGLVLLPTAAALWLLAGCQRYEAKALDGGRALAEWRELSPASEPVRAFAARQDGTTGRAGEPTTAPAGEGVVVGGGGYDPSDGLTLAEAELVALVFNPGLRAARLEAEGARASAGEAGRWADPSVSLDLQRVVSGASDPWVVGGLLNLTVPLSGRLGLERRLARADADVAAIKALSEERRVVADLRRAWVAWSAASARAGALESSVADLASMAASAGRLRDAGELDPTDARLFEIDHVRRRAELLSARRDAARREARVRLLMGLSPEALLELVPTLMPIVPPAGEPDLDRSPAVAVARAEYERAERSLELEVRRQFPDLELGGGFGTDQGDQRALGALTLPLPVLNANRREIAEARARREVARARYEEQLRAVATEIPSLRADLSAAAATLAVVETELAPLADRQVAEALRLLAAGEFEPLVVREAADAATDAKLAVVDARVALAESAIELSHLTEDPFAAATLTGPAGEAKP